MSRVLLTQRIGFEAFATIDVVRAGRVIRSHTSHNVITDEGLAGLQTWNVSQLTNTFITGQKYAVEAATDVGRVFAHPPLDEHPPAAYGHPDYWTADLDEAKACLLGTVEQYRRLSGWSTNDAGVPDAAETDVGQTYWQLVRTRQIQLSDFPILSAMAAQVVPEGQPQTGAFDLASWGLARTVSILHQVADCTPPTADVAYDMAIMTELWSTRRFLDAFDAPIHYRFGSPSSPDTSPTDVALDPGDLIRLTYRLRVPIPRAPSVQNLTIEGVPTTVTSRAYRIDDSARWGTTGLVGLFGGWSLPAGPGGTAQATVGDSNSMPALTDNVTGASQNVDAAELLAQGVGTKQIRYTVAAGGGLFGAGPTYSIGHLRTGNFGGNGATMIHTFNPPVQKTDEEKVFFDIDYAWGRA